MRQSRAADLLCHHERVADQGMWLLAGAVDVDSVPFDDLELGPLLGKGGYGRVYRGLRDGEVLAVKVCLMTTPQDHLQSLPLPRVFAKYSTRHGHHVAEHPPCLCFPIVDCTVLLIVRYGT